MPRNPEARRPHTGAAALEWVLLVVALAGLVAIVLILYVSSQSTHMAPMRMSPVSPR